MAVILQALNDLHKKRLQLICCLLTIDSLINYMYAQNSDDIKM